jgi:hypothetical protein
VQPATARPTRPPSRCRSRDREGGIRAADPIRLVSPGQAAQDGHRRREARYWIVTFVAEGRPAGARYSWRVGLVVVLAATY